MFTVRTLLCNDFVPLPCEILPFRRPIEEILRLLPGPHSDTKRVSGSSWTYSLNFGFKSFLLYVFFRPLNILFHSFYL